MKLAGDTTLQFLTKLFNAVFDEGVYPREWSKAIIIKTNKQNSNNTDNCGVWLAKCYTSLLSKRQVSWEEENDKLSEAQAGFRQGYSRNDHIFTLNNFAGKKKKLSKKGGKLYRCFVDLKVFVSVQRQPLFHILRQNGLSEKCLKALVAIYISL